MIASKVSRETLETAARSIGVRAEVSPLSASGMRHRVKLYPTVPETAWQIDRKRKRLCPVCGVAVLISGETTDGRLIGECGDASTRIRWSGGRRWHDERGDGPYQRESVSYGNAGRRVAAVCWHGFRDFFREVYKVAPDAIFRTSVDTWRGSADFEARYRPSGHRNIGPPIAPVPMAYACRCPERGMAV